MSESPDLAHFPDANRLGQVIPSLEVGQLRPSSLSVSVGPDIAGACAYPVPCEVAGAQALEQAVRMADFSAANLRFFCRRNKFRS